MNSFRNRLTRGGLIGLIVSVGLTLSGCDILDFNTRCEALAPARVQVRTLPLQVTLDHAHSQKTFQPHEDVSQRRTLGLTTANLKTSVRVDINYQRNYLHQTICARPQVDVELTVNPVLVQIGSEYPETSCQYNAILAHEQKHVELYSAYLTEAKGALEKELSALISPHPRIFTSEANARLTFESEIDRLLAPLAQEHLAKVKLLQATLDTSESYSQFNTLCEGRFVPGTDGQLQSPTELRKHSGERH